MLRYFAYIDENTIDSFYNQLENSFVSKKLNKSKEHGIDSEIKISIMSIIRGLFSSDGTLRVSTSRLTAEEVEIVNSIEMKILKLISMAYGDEKFSIQESINSYNDKLICGTIKVIEMQTFLKVVSEYYNEQFENYSEFYKAFQTRKDISDKWNEIQYVKFDYNGLDLLEVMNGYGRADTDKKIYKMVAINGKQPIIMNISSNKITMPHSELRSGGMFIQTTEFKILGIANSTDNLLYIKPLALWFNVSEDV